MYQWGSGSNVLLVGVYVNDLIIIGAEEQKVEAFKAQMKKAFNISNLGLLCFYLGVVGAKTPAGSPSAEATTPSAFSSSAA